MKPKNLRGLGGARSNVKRYQVHPWHIPYNRTCLRAGCDAPVYHDGEVYWSLCLSCLQDTQLGPFRPKTLPIEYEDY